MWPVKSPMIGKRLYNEYFGWFKAYKVQSCMEYCPEETELDGTHWISRERAFIRTENGTRYVVPYTWIYMNSKNENGEFLK